jgi:ABC-type transporter Mla subunit MlaD
VITGLSLDSSDYSAVVEAQIRDDLTLPVDSRASVTSSTLSNPYLSISPGRSTLSVGADGEIGTRPARRK